MQLVRFLIVALTSAPLALAQEPTKTPPPGEADPATTVLERLTAERRTGDELFLRAMTADSGSTMRAARLRLAIQRYDQAAANVERQFERHPTLATDPRVVARLRLLLDRRIESRVGLATSLAERGTLKEAERLLREAERLKPRDARVAAATGKVERTRGEAGDGPIGGMPIGHVAGDSPFGAPPRPAGAPAQGVPNPSQPAAGKPMGR
jgi:hypothetical protein